MSVIFYLGNIFGSNDISNYVNYKSVSITDSNQIKADTLSFDMTVISRATRAPESGNTISILDTTTGNYEFSGIVESVREEMINPITFRYSCDCIDWIKIFDRHLVVEKFGSQTVKTIIGTILSDYANKGYSNWTPFTYESGGLDNIEVGETLDFDFREPSACLDELAEKVGAQWYIGFDRVLRFARPESFGLVTIAPIDGNILKLDSDISSYGDMILTESIGNIKNVVYITDAKKKDEITQQQRFDGAGKKNQYYQMGFIMFLPPKVSDWSSSISAKITDQSSTEVLQRNLTDIRSNSEASGEETNQTIYVDANANSVRLPDKFLLGASERLIVTAYKAVDSPAPFPNSISIELMKSRENLGSDGIYEYKKSEPALWDATGQNQDLSATVILNRYSMPVITGEFYSYLSGWRAGMAFTIQSNIRMNGKLRDGVVFYVKSVSKTIEIYGSSIALSRIKSEITISNNKWEGT